MDGQSLGRPRRRIIEISVNPGYNRIALAFQRSDHGIHGIGPCYFALKHIGRQLVAFQIRVDIIGALDAVYAVSRQLLRIVSVVKNFRFCFVINISDTVLICKPG
ncbi:hypothetical protein SDC9_160299 [bioreactor metagenome]|uniref:Uncharacterized protein n=1 Tax=bioreactor metagenome TaxID=1076179 RepID=A0A645FI07_9ZZZZ